jgi:hypothetical protein
MQQHTGCKGYQFLHPEQPGWLDFFQKIVTEFQAEISRSFASLLMPLGSLFHHGFDRDNHKDALP